MTDLIKDFREHYKPFRQSPVDLSFYPPQYLLHKEQ